MKAKYAVSTLALVLGMPALAGCSGEFEIPFFQQNPGQTVTGEVCRVTDDSILLRTESEEGDGAGADERKAETDPIREFTGEEQEIALKEDTAVRLGKPEEEQADEPDTPEGAPEQTDQDAAAGDTGEIPENSAEELSAADISEGDVISIHLDQKGNASEILVISRAKPGTGRLRESDEYNAATEFAVDIVTDGETYRSTETDENAVHVYGEARAFLKNAQITRNSRESAGGSLAGSYGIGSALLTTNGISYIKDSSIKTDAPGGIGIFSYGKAVSYAMDTAVATRQERSGGIRTAGGGKLYAWNLDVETAGVSSPAVSSGLGGGTIVAEGGNYITFGEDSPAVSCGADVAIREALLTANASEAVRIDGGNSLHLYDCELTGNMGDNLYNDSAWNVLVYQGTAGDSEPGKGTFEMKGGTLTANNGGIFYTTNTESAITLSGVKILYPEVRDFFLKCTGNGHQDGWGKVGANGADCLFTAENQDMEGDILWDDISRLDFYMTKQSTLKGAVVNDKSNAGKDREGYCNLYIEEGSTWVVTGDSALNRLSCSGRIEDDEGQTVTVRGRDGTVYVQGSGKYTVTVLSHEAAANLSGASEMTRWTDHQAELPEEFL